MSLRHDGSVAVGPAGVDALAEGVRIPGSVVPGVRGGHGGPVVHGAEEMTHLVPGGRALGAGTHDHAVGVPRVPGDVQVGNTAGLADDLGDQEQGDVCRLPVGWECERSS